MFIHALSFKYRKCPAPNEMQSGSILVSKLQNGTCRFSSFKMKTGKYNCFKNFDCCQPFWSGRESYTHLFVTNRPFDSRSRYLVYQSCTIQILNIFCYISRNVLFSQWASYQIRKIVCCVCAGNAGNIFPATDFQAHREFAIPACITASASRTCRDVCPDHKPAVTGKTSPALHRRMCNPL